MTMMATIPLPQPIGGGRLEPPMVYVPPTWEYTEIVRPAEPGKLPTEAELNALGARGWELAGVVRTDDAVHFYFKRLAE
jgi:hypothetical protein